MEIKISCCQKEDISHILKLEPILFPEPFDKEFYEYEILVNKSAHYYKLTEADTLVGYGGIQCILDDAHLITIAIKSDYQNKGLGKQLLDYLIAKAKEFNCNRMILAVAINNKPAVKLYATTGFHVTRTRKNYYKNQHAFEMILEWRNTNDEKLSLSNRNKL